MARHGINGSAQQHWMVTGLNFPDNHFANWTMHSWIKPTAAPGTSNGSFLSAIIGSSVQNPYHQMIYNSGSATFRQSATHRRANTTYNAAKATTTFVGGNWYSYGGSWDGSNVKVWVNGVNEATTASAAPLASVTTRLSILALALSTGALDSVGQVAFDGSIAEHAVWNAALSADEFNALAKGISPRRIRPRNLALYTPLVRETLDLKGNALTENNTPGVVTDHPRIYG